MNAPAHDEDKRARRLILFAVAALIGGTAFAWSLYLIREALLVIYLSGMIALGISPAITWLEHNIKFGKKRPLPRWGAVLLFYFAAALVAVWIFEMVVPPFAAQASDLWARLPEYTDKVQRWLVEHRLERRVLSLSELLDRGPSAMTGVLGAVNRLFAFVLGGFTVILLSCYFLLEGEGIFREAIRALPKDKRTSWWRVATDVTQKVGAWMGGQALLCALIGGTAALGFWLIGLPYFYVLALICGVGELVPIVGPVIAALPAIIVATTVGLDTAIITGAYLFVQQQVENSVIVPRLMKSQTGISPVMVMIAILIGGELLGVIGALLAVPTAAIIQILGREYLNLQDAV